MYDHIRIEHIRENNLKDISVEIPYHKHTVIAGVSGSGKSTLAYDVIYATAQRRLLDCMSDQEKIFSRKMKQPRTGNIEGLSTVISLKQIKPNTNPRSTVGTYTSIGSFVRSLTAIYGRCRCLYCDRIYNQTNLYKLIKDLEGLKAGTAVEVGFPWFFHKRTDRRQQLETLRKKGYRWAYVGEEGLDLRDLTDVDPEAAFLMVTENKFLIGDGLKKSDVNSLKTACRNGDHFLRVRLSGEDREGIEAFYRRHGCPEHHMATVTLDASAFSYNDMACACPECMGSGVLKTVHPSKVLKYPRRTLRQGPFFKDVYSMSHPYSYMLLYSLSCRYGFSLDIPYEELPQEEKDLVLYGSGKETFLLQRPQGYEKALPNYLAKEGEAVSFPGILTRVEELYREMLAQEHEQLPWQEEFFKSYMQEVTCPGCGGSRLNKLKDYILLNGKTYSQMGRLEFSQLQDCLEHLPADETSQPVLEALAEQLGLLREIGLDYLSFHRRVDSLSGGEYQRLRIANQAGAGLVGLTYLIDEPTDGLHGADVRKIIGVIKKLLEGGNTVITIEHDLDVIKSADYIIELGPGAGKEGGEVIASGSLENIRRNSNSIIGKLLSAKPEAPRLKLVREMGKYRNRKNLLYLFDEPTVGLHSQDIRRVLDVMKKIVEGGNTVVMVEHDAEMILRSDHVIDMGPGAGRHGGRVMFCGSPFDLLKHRESKTADYLRSRLEPGGRGKPKALGKRFCNAEQDMVKECLRQSNRLHPCQDTGQGKWNYEQEKTYGKSDFEGTVQCNHRKDIGQAVS